jgi:hypothetical protein
MPEARRQKIAREMVKLTKRPDLPAEAITVDLYAQEAGCSEATAARRLEKLVEQKVCGTAIFMGPKRETRGWWFLGQDPELDALNEGATKEAR